MTVARIGLISDTHDHLSVGAEAALDGVDHIVHAGDITDERVLHDLRAIAPVTAVRGNCDHGETRRLPEIANTEILGVRFLVSHRLGDALARVDPASSGVDVVVSGHTHRALIEERDGVLFVNPGSASHPRGGTASSVAVVTVQGGRVSAEIVELGLG